MKKQQILADTPQFFCSVGGESFDVLSFHGTEAVSQLSRFRLSLWSDDPGVDVKALLRQPAEIRLSWGEDLPKEKTYHGIVRRMRQTDASVPGEKKKGKFQEYGHYVCEIVPSFWLLDQKSNCRIFQEMSTPEILAQVLDERGMAGLYELKLTQEYAKREFCVQYRETDRAFLCRLMEEEGIFYWFRHEGEEKMVIGDSPDAYGRAWPDEVAEFKKPTGEMEPGDEFVTGLTYEEGVEGGKVRFRDFNYRDPQLLPDSEQVGDEDDDLGRYEYHPELSHVAGDPFQGGQAESRSRHLATVALEAHAALRKTLSGSGTWRSVTVGSTLQLDKAYRPDLDGEWAVVAASFSGGQEAATGVRYSVSFTAVPAEVPFRPLRRTPRPRLSLQTATVVGPTEEAELNKLDEEEAPPQYAYMDELGRAKVQFHWDLEGELDPSSSCWIRVAQPWAGVDKESRKRHGFQWHPQIGDEVVVDFLEGDPDKPLIVASVYNADHPPLFAPGDVVLGEIRTPYQHQFLMDDLHRSIRLQTAYAHFLEFLDYGRRATLATPQKNKLEMQDSNEEIETHRFLTLTTGGSQTLQMDDQDGEFNSGLGNSIKMSTKDGHYLHMRKGEDDDGVEIWTKDRNRIRLNDEKRNIAIWTRGKHRLIMDDNGSQEDEVAEGKGGMHKGIRLASKKMHAFDIVDEGGAEYIEIVDGSGQHRLKIDVSGSKITIETTSGDIDMLAPSGHLKIKTNTMSIETAGDFTVDCGGSMDTKVASDSSLSATNIEESASSSLTMKGMNVTTEAQVQNKQKGSTFTAEASTINTIKGGLVKIN